MPVTDCIWCAPNNDCGWKRDEHGNPPVQCNPQGCGNYDQKLERMPAEPIPYEE